MTVQAEILVMITSIFCCPGNAFGSYRKVLNYYQIYE